MEIVANPDYEDPDNVCYNMFDRMTSVLGIKIYAYPDVPDCWIK